MMSNKLYIPTSTLNFNNIMSSESISPAEFYSVRGFGYKRFEKVEPNNLNNRIILYNKYPVFDINDNELENYPMVIEIDTKTVNEDVIHEHKDGVFYSEETIYLNPFTTHIFFRNEQEKISTLSKAEPSIETKMISLYQNSFTILPKEIESFKWTKLDIKDSKNDNSTHISKDRKINKLKGFLYAYILGANKSLPNEIVALKKYVKELKNVLSAVITSPDGYPTYKQEEQLKELYKSINNAFFKAEGLDIKLQNIIKQKIELYKCDNFTAILKAEGLFETWYNKQNIKPSFQITQFSVLRSSSPDEKQNGLERYINNLYDLINKITEQQNIKVENFPTIQHCSKIEIIPNQKEFLSKLLNEYLHEAYNSEEFTNSRYEFAKSGGKLFREELHEKWDGSEYQMYLNTLLKNLNEYTPFALNTTDNLTLKSFGAFCQKGDSDIDKLEDYLISNEIGDFRIAFALWGIVFGFANMPKTLTNNLFLTNDLDYISDIYKYIFKQVHNIDLVGQLVRKQEKEIITIPSKLNDDIYPKTEIKDNTKSQQLENKIGAEFGEKLKQIPKITDSQIKSIIEILKNNHFLVNDKLFDAISKIDKLGKRTNLFKAIKECLQPKESQIKQNNNLSLFINNIEPDKDFYKDVNAFLLIENLLPNDKKIKKQFKEDLDWFQDEYRKGDLSQYYGKASRDNTSVIESYNRYVIKKKYSNRINISQIIFKLKESYL